MEMTSSERFLLHCAGADENCAKGSPRSELVKLTSIGKSVIITTLFSSFSFFYAIYLISSNVIASLLLCALWGAFIYNIDRYIVSSMMGAKNKLHEIKLLIPRVVLASIISFTIAVPIELLIFKDEIVESLKEKENKVVEGVRSKFNKQMSDLTDPLENLNEEWSSRKSELSRQSSSCRKEIKEREDSYICEGDGTCGSMTAGFGGKYDLKLKVYEKTKNKCNEEIKNNTKEINILLVDISENTKSVDAYNSYLEKKMNKEILRSKSSLSSSLLSRITVLKSLSDSKSEVKNTVYFIMFLIFSMELMPIFIKFFSARGVYEECLGLFEKDDINKIREQRLKANEEINFKSTEIDNLYQDIKLKAAQFYVKLYGDIKEHKLEAYKERYNNLLDEVLSEASLNDNEKKNIKSELNRYPSLSDFSDPSTEKHSKLFFTFMNSVIFSFFVWFTTGPNSLVVFFLSNIFMIINFYIFYKKFMVNKADSELSMSGENK